MSVVGQIVAVVVVAYCLVTLALAARLVWRAFRHDERIEEATFNEAWCRRVMDEHFAGSKGLIAFFAIGPALALLYGAVFLLRFIVTVLAAALGW